MKKNHIPVKYRLRHRVNTLQNRLDECFIREDGRYYQFCKDCGMTNIQINMNDGKHRKGCEFDGLEAQVAYFKRLLDEVTGGNPWND
jgi:hypothetical protein